MLRSIIIISIPTLSIHAKKTESLQVKNLDKSNYMMIL